MPTLASAARSLDREFAHLYEDHFAFVWRLVTRGGVPMGDVDDVVHDVFLVVHRRLDTFEHRSSVRTWLAGITRRVVWRYRRGHHRARRKHDALGVVATTHEEFSAQRGVAVEHLARFVSALTHEQREVFVLSEVQGLRGPEIAEVTDANLNTVYARIRAARRHFERWCDNAQNPEDRPRDPPPESSRRIWGLLAMDLGRPALAVGTGATSTLSGVKIFAAIVGAGVVVLGTARLGVGPAERPIPPKAQPAATMPASPPRPPPATAPMDPGPSATAARTATTPLPTPSPPRPRASPRRSEPLDAERRLIAEARRQLSTNPDKALSQLDQHQRRFPKGVLAPERLRLTVRAWCRLGDIDQARRAAHDHPSPTAVLNRECPDTESPPAGDSTFAGPTR